MNQRTAEQEAQLSAKPEPIVAEETRDPTKFIGMMMLCSCDAVSCHLMFMFMFMFMFILMLMLMWYHNLFSWYMMSIQMICWY